MDPHTPRQADRTAYGVILAEAAVAAAHAHDVAAAPFEDAQLAADAVTDLERFLAIGGRHLMLLAAPAYHGRPGLRESHRDLAKRLGNLTMERRGGNAWAAAGDALGLANDVLSTHISPVGLLRSTEAETLLAPGVQAGAFARVLGIVSGPLTSANDMLIKARSVQPAGDAPLSRGQAAHLRQQTKAARNLLAAAPPIPLDPATTLDELDRLGPTVTKVGDGGVAGLDALRALRQLSFRQSEGIERANAHTLADLCELGAAACRAARTRSALAHTPLERVQRANVLDRLNAAEATWATLRRQLVPRVQGLSKAPGLYRSAVMTARRESAQHPAVLDAVLATLPRLASDASRIVIDLHLCGDLVTAQRQLGRLSQTWRPVSQAHANALATGFLHAGHATRTAYDGWRDVARGVATGSTAYVAPTASRHLDLGATS